MGEVEARSWVQIIDQWMRPSYRQPIPTHVLFIQSDLGALAPLADKPREVVLGGIQDAIGESGTLVVPAYVKQYHRWDKQIPVSDATTIPNTGALPRLMLSTPGAVRSAHPTHSVLALGAHAREVVADHGPQSACFHPLRCVNEHDGVLMLLGCANRTPGMASVHLAQHDLGWSRRHYLRHTLTVLVPQPDGSVGRHRLAESPGCSRAFDRMYPAYAEAGILRQGNVGPAFTVAVDASPAYEIDMETLRRNPRFVLCDDARCLDCRLTRGYNKRDMPAAAARLGAGFVRGQISRRRGRSYA